MTLHGLNTPNAFRGYVQDGVVHVLTNEGKHIPELIDVAVSQPLDAAMGKTLTIATITVAIFLYNSEEEARSGGAKQLG